MSESKSQKNRARSLLAELAIVLAVVVVTWSIRGTRLFSLIEQGTYDFRLVFRPEQPQAEQIVYLNIDDASLLKFGRWPWPRSHFAEIIRTLNRFGARKVFLDIEFPEESKRILKESITGRSVFHSLDVFQEGASSYIQNVRGEIEKSLAAETVERNLEGLGGYVAMQVDSLRQSLDEAIINPDAVFADALRRAGNVYSVFFVEEPYAQVLVEAQNRLERMTNFVDSHPDVRFEELPSELTESFDAKDLFSRAVLTHYLRTHVEAAPSIAAAELALETDWVSGEIETARQAVLSEAVGDEVKQAPKDGFPEISARVAVRLKIANPEVHEEFLKKAFTKANSQQIVKERFSLPSLPGGEHLELLSSEDFQPPIPLFAQYFRGLGFSNVKPDSDGSIRSVPLLWKIDDRIVMHTAFRVVCDYLGVKGSDISVEPGPRVRLETGDGPILIPTDRESRMLINWAGGFLRAFKHRSLDGVRDYLNLKRDFRFHLQQGDRTSKYAYFAELDARLEQLEASAGDLRHEIERARMTGSTPPSEVASTEARLAEVEAELLQVASSQKELEEQIFSGSEQIFGMLEKGIARETAKESSNERKLSEMKALLVSGRREMNAARKYGTALAERASQLEKIVKGRICMVGSVASGTVDLGTMAYQEVYPKVGVHANLINTVLKRSFLRRMDWWPSLVVLSCVALASGLLFPRVTILSGSILLVELLVAYLAVSYVTLYKYGLWISVAGPICAIFLNYTFISVYRYVTELRQRRYVEKVFAHYLSSDVIAQLIEDPDRVRLGGEEVEITPFFSDVAGFSTISEKLTATQLVELLNEYLSDMTDILLKHQGTLDKFEGDAIIAFFGAPLLFKDHAVKACLCSLEMQERMVELRTRWRQEGKPQMKMRIGLNTGPAVVGNMGSSTRFNYTMMGDTVNLASRLEGANKPYGTYMMISQSTYAAAKDQIEARELDRILVVGKLEPVTVYELLARKGQLDPKKAPIVELYNQGIEAYRARGWEKASELFVKADEQPGGDPASREYIRRCQEFAAFPPPDEWDGTYQLKSKG